MSRYLNAFKRMSIALDYICENYRRSKWCFWLDALWAHLRYGITPNQYIGFGFYKFNRIHRSMFYTARKQWKLEQLINDQAYRSIFWDKAKFNEAFSEFIHRDWICARESSDEEIDEFISTHNKVLVKPNALSSGRGIHIYAETDTYMDLREKDCLLEEYIIQHRSLSAANPTSVNTVRIYTIKDSEDSVHVLSASLRVGGQGASIDNFHAGGVLYPIDIESGVIYQPGCNILGERFIFHPESNMQMVGLRIPNWEGCLSFVERAAKRIKGARMIAWDIAVLENGFEMVEGNYDGDSGVMQYAAKEGKLYEIMQYK